MADHVHRHFWHNRRRDPRVYRERTNILDAYTDEQLRARYRFRRRDIEAIVEELREDLEFAYKRKGSLSATEQVLVALRFFASGSYQIVVGDTINIHRSTVSRTINRVATALCHRARQHIKFPAQAEANRQKRLFLNHGGFPNVIGCIDGTHVRLKAPKDNEHEFVNRSGKHSLNVQVVCDAELRLLNAVVKHPGSVHDSRMLQQSSVWRDFEERHPKLLQGLILGDSGYPLRDWLLTPLLNPRNDDERRFQSSFVRTRATMERCIGVIKRRFNCLRNELQYDPERACKIIKACLVLHNMAINFGTPLDYDNNAGDDVDICNVCLVQPTITGRAMRDRLIQFFSRPRNWCNGVYDCPGHEDEVGCDTYKCPGLYRCRGLQNICLHPDYVCDHWPQCPQHDDEIFCNSTCLSWCTCLGYAFTCTLPVVVMYPFVRYLDARGTGTQPGSLRLNMMLVHLNVASCNVTHLGELPLPNLRSLDLSDNRLTAISVAELCRLKNLQNISLVRNPFSTIFSGNHSSDFHVHQGILHVDLTGVELEVLDVGKRLPFPSLRSLNLSRSGVTRLIGDGFQPLKSLRTLDLRGCPMTEFPRHVLKDMKYLDRVFADNYKLCCEANLPESFNVDNCQAPFNEISSCVALLRADVYRVCLSVLAAMALWGNIGCFALRLFSLTGRGKTGFNVFVTHLCVSDFVMGVYMAMIGVADRLYLGIYMWEESRWRHSATCQVAGVLALLSSEVSALIICLITFDRFLVLRFPFSHLRFSSFSAQGASLLTWVVGILLVSIPLLPFTEFGHFYGQTGICVPLPITRNDFAGHHYAFGVMILLNLVIFLVIATGQISVYLSMTSNAMSSIDTTRKSRDLIVARRLITVVVSDFLCWFPLGMLGVLAAQGVPIPGEVNVAMAIFVLPLNSALNPFLYTLNVIQEKRQRATEAKLLKLAEDLGVKDCRNVKTEEK